MQRSPKFEMPEWAKTGPISLKNYDWRVWQHCTERSAQRSGSHPIVKLGSAELRAWLQYFYEHLGGLPLCVRMLLEQKIESFTAPEQLPQWFDPSFTPEPAWQPPEYEPQISRPRAQTITRANVFVHADNAIYAEIKQRAQQHADRRDWWVDHERRGLWVPLSWIPSQGEQSGRRTFKQLTGDELRAMYAPEPQPEPAA